MGVDLSSWIGEIGNHEELIAHDGVYRHLMQQQIAEQEAEQVHCM